MKLLSTLGLIANGRVNWLMLSTLAAGSLFAYARSTETLVWAGLCLVAELGMRVMDTFMADEAASRAHLRAIQESIDNDRLAKLEAEIKSVSAALSVRNMGR